MRSTARTLALVSCLVGTTAAIAAGLPIALAPGDAAPPIGGRTLAGTRAAVDYGVADVSIVNFWATWCEPCKQEMPELERLYRELPDRLQVVGVLLDEPASLDAVLQALAAAGVTYLTVRPDPDVERTWGGIGIMPTTFLVSPDGRILRRYVGATPAQIRGLEADVRARLEGRPLGAQPMPDTPSPPPPEPAGHDHDHDH